MLVLVGFTLHVNIVGMIWSNCTTYRHTRWLDTIGNTANCTSHCHISGSWYANCMTVLSGFYSTGRFGLTV